MGSGRYLLLYRLAQTFTFFLVPACPVNSGRQAVKPMGSGRYLLLYRLAQTFTFVLVPAWPVNSESNTRARFTM